MRLINDLLDKRATISVVGLGYVGLPLALELAKFFDVIGYDNNKDRIAKLEAGFDSTKKVAENEFGAYNLVFTWKESELSKARFHIIAVPTPIYKNKKPNLKPLEKASEAVGKHLLPDSIVVYESTVYPGLIEEVCIPILEKASGMTCCNGFKVGYSPERINPRDTLHTLTNTVKIVSAIDNESLEVVSGVYSKIIKAGVYRAPNIKTAEAAKIMENCQRDINIAFMNELSMLFDFLQLDTQEVLKAAKTKWNFISFTPGLVGGHCIAVDPYYLIELSRMHGYNARLLTASRGVNESVPTFIADKLCELLKKDNIEAKDARVLVMGITFKENCPDIRNSKTADLIKLLQKRQLQVEVYDPVADPDLVSDEYGIKLIDLKEVSDLDAVIIAISHNEFKDIDFDNLKQYFRADSTPILIDVKGLLEKEKALEKGFNYWKL